jgi:hypothetical protein
LLPFSNASFPRAANRAEDDGFIDMAKTGFNDQAAKLDFLARVFLPLVAGR